MMRTKISEQMPACQLETTGIAEKEYQQLFKLLNNYASISQKIEDYLKKHLSAYQARTNLLLAQHVDSNIKILIVLSGLIIKKYTIAGSTQVCQLFNAFEFMVFISAPPHPTTDEIEFEVLEGTRFFQLNLPELKSIPGFSGEVKLLIYNMLAGMPTTQNIRFQLIALPPNERIKAFHFGRKNICSKNPYPKIPHAIAASYLNMSGPTYLKYYSTLINQGQY